jgi:hypothetical protein
MTAADAHDWLERALNDPDSGPVFFAISEPHRRNRTTVDFRLQALDGDGGDWTYLVRVVRSEDEALTYQMVVIADDGHRRSFDPVKAGGDLTGALIGACDRVLDAAENGELHVALFRQKAANRGGGGPLQ